MASEFWTRDVLEGSLKAAAARFFEWYRSEFFALFPPKTAAWLSDRGDRELILRAGERELWLVDARGAPAWSLSVDEIAASSLEEALSRRGVTRKTAKIGLEIDGSAFFVRRFDIPAVAASNLPRLLIADIERKTPFRLSDVIYGHATAKHPVSPDKLSVSLWILRRDMVVRAIENSGLAMTDLAFVRPSGLSPMAGPAPVIVLEATSESSHLFRNVAIGLCAATALLAALGVGATLWRQSATNEELDAKIQEMSARAAKVRQIADRASAESRLLSVLRNARRTGPLFADLWEETARLLPDGAYVTDLRITEPRANERALELVGFADSAVGLPALFEKSPFFSDAGLTAAITPDAHEKKEGFSLAARIRQPNVTAAK
ncbi:PilN domain-containing protein [Methylocystis sp. WRRC1]|uniref:PilN domain-containing protein n=1 Tax=Methylocystis sp. WRRC1 TaxID=1732014 RepID=UPI001D15D38E|nr:PilN domain-containing protein [Methylocystis sp. WRRC1]MCC3245802.1 PilN domain-containing protein [Methylocystis sp. WRRC1]